MTLALVFGVSAPSASALDCTISNTGPDSDNTCQSIEDFRCTVDNDNNVTVYNKDGQVAETGDAIGVDNTNAGSATSGDANNSNSTVVEGTIKNNTCVIAAPTTVTPPSTPVTPVTPSETVTPSAATPSGGAGAITPVAAPKTAAPVALPNTSGSSTFGIVASIVSLLGLVALGARFAVATYANIKA